MRLLLLLPLGPMLLVLGVELPLSPVAMGLHLLPGEETNPRLQLLNLAEATPKELLIFCCRGELKSWCREGERKNQRFVRAKREIQKRETNL